MEGGRCFWRGAKRAHSGLPCTQAIDSDSENAVYFTNRAVAYTRLGQLDKAFEDSQMAVNINPRHFKAYSTGGTALFLQGKREQAIAFYKRGAARAR